MLLLFATPHCTKCIMTKFQLKNNNIPFKEIFVPDNMDLVEKYGVKSGGDLVDEETGKIVELAEVLKRVKKWVQENSEEKN